MEDSKRQNWTLRLAATLIALPVLYVVTFGPACWIAAAPRTPGQSIRPWMRAWFPVGAAIDRTQTQDHSLIRWWITCGARKGGRILVPTKMAGPDYYGFTRE